MFNVARRTSELTFQVIMIGLIIYTGYVIPVKFMLGWSRWINYINPIAYAFEALIVNEFHNRQFSCSNFVPAGPPYANVEGTQRVCSSVGAVAGQNYVDGDAYMNESFSYYWQNRWRNYGIMLLFMFFFLGVYLAATGASPATAARQR